MPIGPYDAATGKYSFQSVQAKTYALNEASSGVGKEASKTTSTQPASSGTVAQSDRVSISNNGRAAIAQDKANATKEASAASNAQSSNPTLDRFVQGFAKSGKSKEEAVAAFNQFTAVQNQKNSVTSANTSNASTTTNAASNTQSTNPTLDRFVQGFAKSGKSKEEAVAAFNQFTAVQNQKNGVASTSSTASTTTTAASNTQNANPTLDRFVEGFAKSGKSKEEAVAAYNRFAAVQSQQSGSSINANGNANTTSANAGSQTADAVQEKFIQGFAKSGYSRDLAIAAYNQYASILGSQVQR